MNQNVIGMKVSTVISLIQFVSGLDDEGSKTEKMFVIIVTELGNRFLALELNFPSLM